MNTPIADMDALRIGIVDFVSPDEIKVLLDIEAPNDLALNTGTPRPFPRINSYVLVQGENGFLVSQIEWITIERSQFPKRQGMKDFGLVDLPYPLRKMSINPLGMLKRELRENGEKECYVFSRGVESFPTVGDPVLLPTKRQLLAVVESGENRRVNIGVSPMAGNASVSIDPDRLFGRHLAVLGNTGSGKSCSVAGLIRWSIEEARKEENKTHCSARFVILDPNGEYSRAFSDLNCVNVFAVEKDDDKGIKQLKVPIWLWNTEEWAAFTKASGRAQRPTLIQALRAVRSGDISEFDSKSHDMRKYLQTLISITMMEYNTGSPWGGFPRSKNFYEKIKKWNESFNTCIDYNEIENAALQRLKTYIDSLITPRSVQYPNYDFTKQEIVDLISEIKNAHKCFGGTDQDVLPIDANVPIPFSGEDFLRSIEANAELMNTMEYSETMIMRIRTLLSDSKLKKVILDEADNATSLSNWLNDYICPSESSNERITVIDLSMVPAELTHIITAVVARMVLEALQRYRKLHGGTSLPVTLVMEEAHTFIKRYAAESEYGSASEMCSKVFEKIAREGRKFGLGLIISSQRPSELSQTVLSQCNSFLLHRISNDRDQELVSKLVPDNLRGLLRELPSLPARNAILLGWASELPVLVRMNKLKDDNRPKSDDPDFWHEWTVDHRNADWDRVADEWQKE